jgi:hypothetical protein
MGWFIVLIGALMMIKGAALIVVPRKLIHLSQKILSGKNAKRLGWIPLCVGVLLCMSAKYSYAALAVFILGLLAIAKGAYILVTPVEKLRKLKWLSLSDKIYRILGILALIVGMLLINIAS